MDGTNWRPAQQEAAGPDWRLQLSLDSRNRIVNKIIDTLKKCLPISGPDGVEELQKISVRFEEKIYAQATSQTDFLRRISVRMITMETKSHSGVDNSSSLGGQISSDSAIAGGGVMDGGNWRQAQQVADWRLQLFETRNRIVNKILDASKKRLLISGPDGVGELQKIAVRFEEKIYAAATSQTDYLRRISVKMLTMETKSQSGVANSSSLGGQIPSYSG